ncbi:uncharacterized protein F4807DRAFT_465449 [Annulohypoxylon truncatum]|uniref:uncharacterized protein n=1 Tax=Annulohypoxylon truncatum TaxID=327061 RepID=UPI002008E773|nr:uncharacterized protein F4807DRAFT_465449 [Annulohypoxylon truncatum]KAI1204675.1 hypothetical protein F4807DRAFT_465449 [Annulohypoxylon truncatum]
MAFQQPARQATQRVFRPTPEDEESPHIPQPTPQAVEDSQTWVLFSPATDAATSTSYLTSTHKTNTTPGRSRVSEIGSFGTVAQSNASADRQQTASLVDAAEGDDEDDAELDSLDSHLPEFRSTPIFYGPSHGIPFATPVVPAHDGLGSFRLEQEGMGTDVQDRLYAFEQYNPRRIRRRESLDLAQAELENERIQELDKRQRIENWRLEQSRYLLEEIQKETRRRRRSLASTVPNPVEQKAEDLASLSGIGDMSKDEADQSQTWHDHDENELEGESIWGRITRKVIRDLMGIDDKLLSVLFGEELPDEEDLSTTPKVSAMPTSQQTDAVMEDAAGSGWQLKMLERVAKELGSLIHRLSEHPGAFSTFSRVQQMPLPYAGLPSIPEGVNDTSVSAKLNESHFTMPEFQPTIRTQPQPKALDIPSAGHPVKPGQANPHAQLENSGGDFTQDEWEQELDVRLVFRYLRSRFMSRSSSSGGAPGNTSLASSSMQDAAAKAARVRQHHPLMSRPRTVERRRSKATVPSSPVLFKHASSCASQSTRRSVRKSSCSSSRHYWDIGGSVGTGSIIAAATGPMGSWGEV